MLLNERAQFDLARQLRLKTVPLGEVFSFLSGLYFRAKLAYAKTFVQPPPSLPGIFIITTNRGLLGSIATGKYVDVLSEVFGERLRFPAEFVGRCAADGTELESISITGAVRRGKRPEKLIPRRYSNESKN